MCVPPAVLCMCTTLMGGAHARLAVDGTALRANTPYCAVCDVRVQMLGHRAGI